MTRSRKVHPEEHTPLLSTASRKKDIQDDEDTEASIKSLPYSKKSEVVDGVSFFDLFRFASQSDLLIMGIGTIFAIIHGSGMPLLGLILSSMSKSFSNSEVIVNTGGHNGTLTASDETVVSKMAYYCILYACLGVLSFIAAFIQTYCWEFASASQVFKLRRKFFRQVLRQEISWFDEHQTGDLALNLLDDLERFQEGVGQCVGASIQFVTAFVLGIVFGLVACWKLTLIALALLPFFSLKSSVIGKYSIRRMIQEKEKYAQAGAITLETLASNRTVAAFGGEQKEIQRYKNALASVLVLSKKRIYFEAVGVALSYFFLLLSNGITFWFGGTLLHNQMATPSEVLIVIVSTLAGFYALGHAIPFFSLINVAQASAARVYRIIDTVPDNDPYSTSGARLDRVLGKLQFSDVSFAYPQRNATPVLKRINFTVQPGQTVGLMGSSGSGKSTIVSLLLRFCNPQHGEILLDGADINSLNLHWLREQIGFVSQEPVLFSTTIFENIALGSTRDVSIHEVIDVAKMANVHDFIVSLPQGYNTQISGTKLSGGQKQRIAIARAIIRNPRFLVLDEATSALDGRSEAMVQIGLQKAMRGRTTIVIAHRLSTIRDADVIYAIKDGTLCESGTHEELMEKGGFYHQMVTAQVPMEAVEDTDTFSAASTVESVDDSVFEFEFKRKRQRTMSHRLSMTIDPMTLQYMGKDQLRKEVGELNIPMPSVCKILGKSPLPWVLAIGTIGAVFAGFSRPIHGYLYGRAFAVVTGDQENIIVSMRIIAFLYFLGGIVSGFGYFINILFVSWSGESLTTNLRLESYNSVIRQHISWFDDESNSPSRVAARLARDVPLVNMAAGQRLGIAMIAFMTVVTSLVLSFYFGYHLASVMFLAFPVITFSAYIQVKTQTAGQLRESQCMESAGNIAIESIQSIRTVQALCQEDFFYHKYRDCIEPVYLEAKRQGVFFGLALGMSGAILYFVYSGSFWYGAQLVDEGLMTPNGVYRVFFLIAFCSVAVGHMTSFIPNFQKARLASALIFNLIELKSEIDPMSTIGAKPPISGDIEFRDVTFSYPSRPDIKVLQGLSFRIGCGQTLAVVGTSGSGKSTVVSLVERFYDVISGAVLVDGVDIRNMNVAHLRKHIGLVQQEPVLFDASIRDNIVYGYVGTDTRALPTDMEIEQSARDANIHDFIMQLPKGYDTIVGERAVQLSGGQKQRVAIARALIRNPRILLLDEATSALDMESEHIVQEALDRAREGRTCIIIAHRISTIQNADVIAVVSNGRIFEIGTPEKLIAKKGIYYRILKKQSFRDS